MNKDGLIYQCNRAVVFGVVASSKTAKAAAERLGVSVGTLAKFLEENSIEFQDIEGPDYKDVDILSEILSISRRTGDNEVNLVRSLLERASQENVHLKSENQKLIEKCSSLDSQLRKERGVSRQLRHADRRLREKLEKASKRHCARCSQALIDAASPSPEEIAEEAAKIRAEKGDQERPHNDGEVAGGTPYGKVYKLNLGRGKR